MERPEGFPQLLVDVSKRRLTRRGVLRRAITMGLSVPVLFGLLAACGEDEDAAETPDVTSGTGADETPAAAENDDATPKMADEGVYGGTLIVALNGEPPTFDIHNTSAIITTFVSMHMFETLFTWDAEFQLIPDLAESHEVNDEGLVHTVRLRQGVLFHNGEEMTASDVIASIERWGQSSGIGQGLLAATEEIREVDDSTVEFHLSEPFGTLPIVLARQNYGCAIYPASVIEAAGDDALGEFVGTGPYQFVEHQPDRHIRLARFEDYVSRDEEPSGYGGAKHAYLDEIRFVPVPDEAARMAGLQAGDYHYVESVSNDQYETLDADLNVVVEIVPPIGWTLFLLNTRAGLMQNLDLRRAVQTGLDPEPIMLAALGEDFYRLDPGLMLAETVWHSTAGEDLYNQANPDRAHEMLDELGYDGTPVRFIATEEYREHYNASLVAVQQLEQIGFTVDLQTYDWATLLDRRNDAGAWDMCATGFSFRIDPVQLPSMSCDWGGFWCTDEKVELTERLLTEPEFESRYETWEAWQRLAYEEVPFVKLGDNMGLIAHAPAMRGFNNMVQISPVLWNVWLEA